MLNKVLFGLTLISLLGCASSRSGATPFEQLPISITKLPCLGRCPELKLTIHPSGKVFYEGMKHVLITGKRNLNLDKDKLQALYEIIDDVKWDGLDEKYVSNKRDLPGTSITYGDQKILIKGRKEAPPEIQTILAFMEELIQQINQE